TSDEAAASALLTEPSWSLSSVSKLGLVLCALAPLPVPAPEGALAPGCACGVAGSDMGDAPLPLDDVEPEVCAYALPTARLNADRAINACFSNFMVELLRG